MRRAFLTVDVEDWFQVENLKGAINREDWSRYDLRVVNNTQKLLKLLRKYNIKVTFFVLGWVAERVPELILEIHQEAHEIASHGYSHLSLCKMTPHQFRNDIVKSKKILEMIINVPIYGYRAPNFSIKDWAIEILREEGFRYDSSFYPTSLKYRYGFLNLKDFKNVNKYGIYVSSKGFYEFPVSSLNILNFALPWGGGAYFRILPPSIFRMGVKRIVAQGNYYNFYIHPWEFDSKQPRVHGTSVIAKFKTYYGLSKTEEKFKQFLGQLRFMRIIDFICEVES